MKSTKHFLLFIIALISINVNAQEAVSITINVASAGSLPSLIPSSRKEQITNLTLTGFLNGTDIRFIREMAGQNYDGSSTVGILSVLDLSNAKIVGGGEPFIKLYGSEIYSSKDTIGDGTFSNCTRLTSVTLPNSVVTIGMLAFSGCKGLNSVIIPNSVKSIWGYAFSNCPALTSIIIPNSVTFIGSGAFDYCKSLTSITLSNSLTTIGGIAFRYCTSLTSITIPNSVTTIGENPFSECYSLMEIIVLNDNSSYKSIDGVLLSIDMTKLISYPNAKSNTYVIPNSVTSIETKAFNGCIGLISVTIPNSVTTIGNNAFTRCTGLVSVTLPNSVVTIGRSIFSECEKLTSVTLPNSLTTIGLGTFSECTGLTSITIPNSVKSIEDYVFTLCSGLTSINIPNSVTTIGKYAFSYCTSLTSITIPNSVTTIGDYAFNKCSQIKQLYCQGTTPPKIDSNTFSDIYNTCKLYIPKGSSTVYWVAPYWSNFKYITEQVTTSISDCEASNTNVYSENGYIVVKGGKLGDIINIYSVTGSLLHKIKITDDIVRISVAPQSLYIVKTGDRSFKIAL